MLDFNLLDDNEADLFEIEEVSLQEIAIIGLSAQLPLVDNIEQFWQYICNGVDFISEFPAGRRKDMDLVARSRSRTAESPHYFEGAYLDHIDQFDYSFFRLSPKEASLMTPNQRLFLQTAWKSIEDAGYCKSTLAGSRTGVFVGYNSDNLYDYKRMISDTDPELLSLGVPGNISSIIAGRISYLLDLTGPSLCVDTACSSSLVAVHLACQAIRNQECEMAIAGSVKINLLPLANEVKIGIESSSWRARSFDDSADGTGAGEGVVSFVLKPLSKALQDGDAIHAVIKGSAVNQDGSSVGLTAPNVAAQEDVLIRAWDNAGIHPETLSYMEAHGTGTKLGDPIEIAGIDRAFRKFTDRKQFVAIGSVKSNVGHLDHAAGAMGLLKAVLAMKNKQIPPLMHFERPNRSIDFITSPVYVNDQLSEWRRGESPRRCGVSAFGISGTNCHLVLEEAPSIEAARVNSELMLDQAESISTGNILTLSAKSQSVLHELISLYRAFDWDSASTDQICYTSQTGRDHHEFRVAIVFDELQELLHKLELLVVRGLAPLEQLGIYYGSHKPAAAGAAANSFNPEGRGRNETALHYVQGADIVWSRLHADKGHEKVHLPTYPFERSRCWLEPATEHPLSEFALAEQSRPLGTSGAVAVQPVELIGSDQGAHSHTEQAIAQIWGEVLGFRKLNREDNFFELGGDSILALKIVNRISTQLAVDVKVADLFTYASLSQLAVYIDSLLAQDAGQSNMYRSLLPASSREYYPLTSSQYRVFVQEQLGAIGTANNSPFCIMAEGVLDKDRFNEAFRHLVARHESLRTLFAFVDGEAVQKVIGEVEFQVSFYNSSLDRVDELIDEFVRPFDLINPPLMRVGLVTLQPSLHLIMIDLHHIIADGMSTSILMKEFCERYKDAPLTELQIQYKDYAVWQQQLIRNGELKDRKDYWVNQLSRGLPLLAMPTDFPRAERKHQGGSQIRIPVEAGLKQQLEQLGKSQRLTMNSLLFALYSLLLHSYTGQENIIVGTLTAGRNHPDLERVFGMFINFLPIRVRIRPELTFTDYLAEVNQSIGAAYANDYPFDLMISDLQLQTPRSRNPLYDTMFVYHNEYKMNPMNELHMEDAGLSFAEYPLKRSFSPLDLKLDVWHDSTDQLVLVLEYDRTLFTEQSMSQLLSSFLKLASLAVANPELPLSRLTITNVPNQEEIVLKETGAAYDVNPPLQVAVSATFTSEPISEYMTWWCKQFNMPVKVSFAGYHQVFQELLDPNSLLADNDGVNLLLIRFEDWIRDNTASNDSLMAKLEKIYVDLVKAFGNRKKGVPYFVGVFPVTEHTSFDSKLVFFLEALNDRWKQYLSALDHVFVMELDETVADLYEVTELFDKVKDREGHVPFTDEFYAAIGTVIARKIVAWRRQDFKVIVLDCDNTLWRGICGEDGPGGVAISGPFKELQSFMLERYKEGMLLAISSKNNEADVWETFAKHPGMILKREHFAASRINWGTKSTAVRELAEQLNVGLDSFIFIDDSEMECMELRQYCPTVLTLQLPVNEQQIPAYLQHVWAFDKLVITEEDRKRTVLYAAESKRRHYQQNEPSSMDEFLRGLELRIGMTRLSEDQLSRAAQLTQRTNQFNMSVNRRTEDELLSLLSLPDLHAWSIEVEDRFGEYGFVGLVIGRFDQEAFVLDTFLLSCRVLGRGVEHAILAELKKAATTRNVSFIEAPYVASAKNIPFREFLDAAGWEIADVGFGVTSCRLHVDRIRDYPPFITLVNERLSVSPETPNLQQARKASSVHAAGVRQSQEGYKRDWHSQEVFSDPVRLTNKSHLLPLRYHSAEMLVQLTKEVRKSIKDRKADYREPVTKTERELVEIWEDVLGIQPIGVMDHFFDLGGNSLQAVSVASRIHRQFDAQISLRDLFAVPTVRDLAELIHRTDLSAFASITPVEDQEQYPVTSSQKRLLVLAQMDVSDTAYNQPCFFRIEGALDFIKLQVACEELVRRHQVLRTLFHWNDNQFVQSIAQSLEFAVEFHELGTESVEEHVAHFIRPFDLERAPLFRAGVLQTGEHSWILMLDMHHIVADGVSISIMINELMACYQGNTLPELNIQYRDFAVWQHNQLNSERMLLQERFWLETFADEVPVLNLPLDSPRPAVRGYAGHRLSIELDIELYKAVQTLAVNTGATPYMVFLAAYNVLLAKYSGQEDIIVGSPAAGRPHTDLDQLIGMFVHTIVLRNKPSGQASFRQFIAQVKENTLQALEHQDFPFEELVEKLDIQRNLSRNPLFDTMFVYQNMSWSTSEAEDLHIRMYPHETHRSRFDLTLELSEYKDEIGLNVEYSTELFQRPTMERLIRHYLTILKQVTQSPELLLSDIDMLAETEKARLLFGFNATQDEVESDKTMQLIFEEQVQRTPEAIALVYRGHSLTYAQLNNKANCLAVELRAMGVKRNQIVAILIERSLEMVTAVLGVLKAGAAYLPIDPHYPEERIQFMLEDSRSGIVISKRQLADRIPSYVKTLYVQEDGIEGKEVSNPSSLNKPTDLAYVIYTSGSTGTPKGVMVEHKGMVNLQVYFQQKLKASSADKIIQFASFSFDASVWEMFMALFNGAELHLMTPEVTNNYNEMERYLNENEITIATLPPTYLVGLEPVNVLTLRTIITAGSSSTMELLEKWRDKVQYINAYGPTESTICATVWDAPANDSGTSRHSVSIGAPIPNTQVYIVSPHDQLQPIGIPGELCVGGAGLARGYLHRPELTEKQFTSNPFVAGTRMYRTGDLARWLPNGTIEYLGRMDNQVKIRGYRIELGEVESCLIKHPLVVECMVISRAGSQDELDLCAYIGTKGHKLAIDQIRSYLSEQLPDYMIPAFFIIIDELPLTSNGKVDKRALPEPDKMGNESYVPPRNDTERRLARMWSELLGAQRVGVKDHFFELGGHSLKAISLLTRIHKELGTQLTLKQIFQAPTIEQLAREIQGAEQTEVELLPAADIQSSYPVTYGQKKMYVLQQLEGVHTAYNISGAYRIEGDIDIQRLEHTFVALVQRHEALRTSFAVEDGEFVQYIHPNIPLKLHQMEAAESQLEEILRSLIIPFDLSQAPLLRVTLVRINNPQSQGYEGHVLFIDMHHIISDGVSANILIQDFLDLYVGVTMQELRVHYKDYAVWQHNPHVMDTYKQQEQYWMNVLSGNLPRLQLPTDFPRPAVQNYEGSHVSQQIDQQLTKRLRAVASDNGCTLYMVLLSGFVVLLSKYSGQEDIIVGTPSAGRTHSDVQPMIGMFVNTLIIRTQQYGQQPFVEMLEAVKENTLSAFDNQDYPFDQLTERLRLPRDVSRNPLFDAMFILQNFDTVELKAEQLSVKPYPFLQPTAKFDLSLEVTERDEELACTLNYAVKLYRGETAERILVDYVRILSQIAMNPEAKLQEIQLVDQIVKRKNVLSKEIEFNF